MFLRCSRRRARWPMRSSSAVPLYLRGPVGHVVRRPWFDTLLLKLICHTYFPLSRAWAAACAAEGHMDRFCRALPGTARHRRCLRASLRRVESHRHEYERALADWRAAFFDDDMSDGALGTIERRRHTAAHAFMATRRMFVPWLRHLPAIRWNVASPESVAAKHGARLDGWATAFPPVLNHRVEQSRAFAGHGWRTSWLRFRAPVSGDHVNARVMEPLKACRGTLIQLHGIAIEQEMWCGLVGTSEQAIRRKLRVITPEGPWHGTRSLAGWFGGEPVLGLGPMGMLDFLQTWVAEVGVLINWARRQGGPVAVSGISLGALTAQIVAGASMNWPPELRPDGVMVVATTGDTLALMHNSRLLRAVGYFEAVSRAGWHDDSLAKWQSLLQPSSDFVYAPEQVVMVLGTRDEVTPYLGGARLARRWGVGAENLFERRQGHFGASLGLLTEVEPLERFWRILGV